MEPNQTMPPDQRKLIPQSQKKNYIVIIVVALLIGVLASLSSFYLGVHSNTVNQTKLNLNAQISPTVLIQKPTLIPETSPTQTNNNSTGTYTQNINGITFSVGYYHDPINDVNIMTPKNSNSPISAFQNLLSEEIAFGSSPVYYVAVSDTDPTTCYTSTCKGAITSIQSTTNILSNGIQAKKIQAVLPNDGGPNTGEVSSGGIKLNISPVPISGSYELYIIPFAKHYYMLYTSKPDAKFESMFKGFSFQ